MSRSLFSRTSKTETRGINKKRKVAPAGCFQNAVKDLSCGRDCEPQAVIQKTKKELGGAFSDSSVFAFVPDDKASHGGANAAFDRYGEFGVPFGCTGVKPARMAPFCLAGHAQFFFAGLRRPVHLFCG